MLRKSWNSPLLAALARLGSKVDLRVIDSEKSKDPEASTMDIVQRMSLAPPEVVAQALEIAAQEGDPEVLEQHYRLAQSSVKATREASRALGQLAINLRGKG